MDIDLSKIWLVSIVVALSMAIPVGAALVFIKKKRLLNSYSPFTENSLRLPGHKLRENCSKTLNQLGDDLCQYLLAAIGFVIAILVLPDPIRSVTCFAAFAYMAYLLVKIWNSFEKIRNLRLGLEGEEYTGQELNLLMLRGAYVFHDIPYKYGNIDHIVIGGSRAFAIETKSFRKPRTKDGKQIDANVVFDGKSLKFPRYSTGKPVLQAKRHAEFLREVIRKKCGVDFDVLPVVALPGWNVKIIVRNSEILIINPKRGKALNSWLGNVTNKTERDHVVRYIASVARSVNPSSEKYDPDASENYDFWLNPRVQEVSLE